MYQDIKIKVKQIHDAECQVVFLVVLSVFRPFSIFFDIKKVQHGECDIEKVQHGNSRHVARTAENI